MARKSRSAPKAKNNEAAPTGRPDAGWLPGAILFAAIVVAYIPAYFAGFVWDDKLMLTQNPAIVGPYGLWQIWTTHAADICPLTLTLFWLEHKLWGLAPFPYHFFNVLMHATCAVLLGRVLLRLRIPGAWLGAALWALHPLQASSVAWVAEMKNTQSGIFFLLAILYYLKALTDAEDKSAECRRHYVLMLVFAVLAMASKTSTMVLPAVLGLCGWWLERRLSKRTIAMLGPLVVAAILPVLLSLWTQQPGSEGIHWARTFPERLATAGMAAWFYLGKLIFPYPQMMIYPRWQVDVGDPISFLPLAALVIGLFVLWLYRATWGRPYFFAFAYFIAALLPVLGLVEGTFWKFSFVADHFQYLASMGPLALVAALASQAWTPVDRNYPQLGLVASTAVLLIFGALTWQRALVFKNDETLWIDTLVSNPDCWIAHNDLGTFLLKNNQPAEAAAHIQRAVDLNPYYSAGHQNLGVILLKEGRVDDALAEFQTAIQIDPKDPGALDNLGNALLHAGKLDAAIQAYQASLRLNPVRIDARNGYGLALLQLGRADEAIADLQQLLADVPHDFAARINLGFALLQKGRWDDALAQFNMAVELNANVPEAYNGRGVALAHKGLETDAIDNFQRAIAINPNDPEFHNNLGSVFVQQGQLDDAIAQFNEALRLHPGLPDAQQNLVNARARLQKGSATTKPAH